MLSDLRPTHVNHLFRPLASGLITLLEKMPRNAWLSATCYPAWTVHDIATHLLLTGISRLSSHRDHFSRSVGPSVPADYESLSEAIDRANTRWFEAFYTVSPHVVVDLLRATERQLARYFARLGRSGVSPIGVGWAGEEHSEIWFETAREFTERWHHQQQIRDAVGAPGIATPRYLRPVLETLMRALPNWYAPVVPPEPAVVEIRVSGKSGGIWSLSYGRTGWRLFVGTGDGDPAAAVTLSEDTAWRFLTRSITSRQAESRIERSGDALLSGQFLQVVAVMMPKELR